MFLAERKHVYPGAANDLVQQWRRIDELTDRLLHHAGLREWEMVSEYEEERRALIEALFSAPVTVEDYAFLAAAIPQLLEMDERIIMLIKHAQEDCLMQLQVLDRGKQMSRAYAGE